MKLLIKNKGSLNNNFESYTMEKISNKDLKPVHIKDDDYPNIEDIASYVEALKLFKLKGKINDPECIKLIDNLPDPSNIRKKLSNYEIKIIFHTIGYLWQKITGYNLISDSKIEKKAETLDGNYWMILKGVLISGPNHFTIIKNNLILFRALLGLHSFAVHEKMASPPNELIKMVLDNGGIRIFANKDGVVYFQLSAETYAKWGKKKIKKYNFPTKIIKIIDINAPYNGWTSGLSIRLKGTN